MDFFLGSESNISAQLLGIRRGQVPQKDHCSGGGVHGDVASKRADPRQDGNITNCAEVHLAQSLRGAHTPFHHNFALPGNRQRPGLIERQTVDRCGRSEIKITPARGEERRVLAKQERGGVELCPGGSYTGINPRIGQELNTPSCP